MSLGLGKQEMAGIMSASGPYWTHADLAIACANDVDGYKLILRLIFRAFSQSPRPDTQARHFSTSSDA
jgi:hypothetical protein